MTRYPEYAATGLDWCAQAPAHWQRQRNATLFRHRVETGHPELPILEVSLRTGVRVRSFEAGERKQVMRQRDKYKRAAMGDIAYNMMRMWQGALGTVPVDGLVSPAYVVVAPEPGVNTDYFAYLFRTDAYQREVNKFSRGIVADRNRLYWHDFRRMPSLMPPRDEQDQIVAFLRAHDVKLGRLVRCKQSQIAKLSDRREALLEEFVGARAFDRPHSAHVSKPLKAWARINGSTLSNVTDSNFSFRYIDIGCVGRGELTRAPVAMKFKDAPSRARRIVRSGDVLIATVRPYLRAIWQHDSDQADLIASTGFAVLTAGGPIIPGYLALAVQTASFIDQVIARSVGVAYPAIAEAALGRIPISAPRDLAEQQRMIEMAADRLAPIQDAILAAKREIDFALEYRTRLIADVVTGQRDVRGWRPRPDDVTDDAEASAAWSALGGSADHDTDDDHSLQGAAGHDEPDGHE